MSVRRSAVPCSYGLCTAEALTISHVESCKNASCVAYPARACLLTSLLCMY